MNTYYSDKKKLTCFIIISLKTKATENHKYGALEILVFLFYKLKKARKLSSPKSCFLLEKGPLKKKKHTPKLITLHTAALHHSANHIANVYINSILKQQLFGILK